MMPEYVVGREEDPLSGDSCGDPQLAYSEKDAARLARDLATEEEEIGVRYVAFQLVPTEIWAESVAEAHMSSRAKELLKPPTPKTKTSA